MKAYTELFIKGTKEAIWQLITDIEHSADTIKAIEKIEVLEKPEDFIGFKWRETRMMFGKEATEVMWITDYEENKFYRTRAESHGAIYISELTIREAEGGCFLGMGFEGQSITFGAKIMAFVFDGMMKKSTEKAFLEDLQDIKRIIEA